MYVWTPTNGVPEARARNVLSAAQFLHSTFKDEVWLWRGQADGTHRLEPGMHSRVLKSEHPHTNDSVSSGAEHLLDTARAAEFDRREGVRLPDLALLAVLQHYGAATPLLDVTTDPLIALWMIAFSDGKQPDRLDGKSGRLFGILRPPRERWLEPLDARAYSDVAREAASTYFWYRAPDVTDRLAIQRGSFLLSGLNPTPSAGSNTSFFIDEGMGIELDGNEDFVSRRLKNRGSRGNTAHRTSEVFAINVPGSLKAPLRELLADRSGLDVGSVYPTPWHQPFVEQFALTYRRSRPLDRDLPAKRPRVDVASDQPPPACNCRCAFRSHQRWDFSDCISL